ncbi:MAG: hypothetical protein ABI462_04230 [Ignavibacteria bacterium]
MTNTETSYSRNGSFDRTALYKSLILSLLVLIGSIFFGNIFQIISGYLPKDQDIKNFSAAMEASNRLWLYPVVIYVVFLACLWGLKNILDRKFAQGSISGKELTKIVEKWSGIVDGIGTALPLIGAAVILFTVGLGKQYEDLFLKFAVPFEIKSLFILAIAKLFESAFDELEIQYLSRTFEDDSIAEDIASGKNVKVEIVNLPDMATLEQLNSVITGWNMTVKEMKDPEFKKSLETILKITGK